jgi:hypothetical protein
VDRYGFFEAVNDENRFTSPADWNAWQKRDLINRISGGEWDGGKPFFKGEPAKFFSGYRDERMKSLGEVQVNMTINGITVTLDGETREFSFSHIDSLTVAMQRNLEFYHDKSMYRLQFPAPRASAYKYLSVFEAIEEAARLQEDAT